MGLQASKYMSSHKHVSITRKQNVGGRFCGRESSSDYHAFPLPNSAWDVILHCVHIAYYCLSV